MNNLFPYESTIRVFLGIGFLIFGAVGEMSLLMMMMGIMLIVTGSFHSCILYNVFGINKKESDEQYYLSLLPKYNPEPILIFDKNGKVVFKNRNVSQEILDEIPESFLEESYKKSDGFSKTVDLKEKIYLTQFRVAKEPELILGYGFNITDSVKLQEEIISTQKEIVYKMGEIGESRSQETGNHVKRVAEYSYLLAILCGLDEKEAEILKTASPMHDIGKVAIPDAVLKKPGKLEGEEWEVMKTHASIGYELLKVSERPILKAAAIVAKEHHEKWDGSGYPLGIKEEGIHIYGRITAVADVFDALGSERVYKKAWELGKILEFFESQKGTHFDPKLVELFFDNLEDFLEIRDKYKDN